MAIRDILLARRTGCHVHLCHMSTRGAVALIRWGTARGIPLTASLSPHHLARRTGGTAPLSTMSTRGWGELSRRGKERGIRGTAAVCPHQLSLTEEPVGGYETNAKMIFFFKQKTAYEI